MVYLYKAMPVIFLKTIYPVTQKFHSRYFHKRNEIGPQKIYTSMFIEVSLISAKNC